MNKYKYTGIFFDLDSFHHVLNEIPILAEARLEKVIPTPHITFQYMPDVVPTELFGTIFDVTITGYGIDSENEGVSVTLSSDIPVLQDLISQIPVPHITISISETGKAVNTRYLTFTPIEPLHLTGIFGAMSKNKELCLNP